MTQQEERMALPFETAYGPLTAVAEWLTANGIDPADVPIDADITIEMETFGGDRCIRYTALLRNEDGYRCLDPTTDQAATEQRTARLKVDPPANVQVTDNSK